MISQDDDRHQRPGVTQMGDAEDGDVVGFCGNARIEACGLKVADIKRLLRRVDALETEIAKLKPKGKKDG